MPNANKFATKGRRIMGADYYLYAIVDDEKVKKIQAVMDACDEAGMEYPEEIQEMSENGSDGRIMIWTDGSCEHESVELTGDNPYYPVRIDLSKLPKGTQYIELDCRA